MKTILKTTMLFLLLVVTSCIDQYVELPVSASAPSLLQREILTVLPEGWPAGNDGGVMDLVIKGQDVKVPYWYNKSIDQTSDKIKKVVIAIHGINRWSKVIKNRIMTSVDRENLNEETLVICPVFLQKEEHDNYNLDSSFPWFTARWKYGDLSQDQTVTRISSFEIIDEMLSVIEKNNPKLQLIVVTGYSAGGQFTNRYAASGRGPDNIPAERCIENRFIVHAPSSYVYLSDKRWSNSSFQTVSNSSCNGYDNYQYGLGANLNSYLITTTVPKAIENYKKRTVIHMVGENDDTLSNLDVSCRANLQGSDRVIRAITYYRYLLNEFSSTPEYTKNKYLLLVDGSGHSSDVYAKEQVSKYMFDKLSGIPNSNE